MSEHTPGPWEWWTSNSWKRLRHSERGVSTNVLLPAVCKDGQATIDVSPADMVLIAAAPDLLAALKNISMNLEHDQRDPRWALSVIRRIARGAIAKMEKPINPNGSVS
jgi:hypothetical protein